MTTQLPDSPPSTPPPPYSSAIPSSSSYAITSTTDNNSQTTFICIISDLTNALNTCARRSITLSSQYTIEQLIKEVGKLFKYDPFSFNLIFKFDNTEVNFYSNLFQKQQNK
jgi:hypothetical protein